MDEDRDGGDDRKVCGREIRRGHFESGEGLRRCSTNHTSAHWLHLLSLNFRATKIDGKSRCAWRSSSSRARGPPGAECCGRGGCPWVRTTQRTPSWLPSLLVTPRPTVGRSVLAHSPFHTEATVFSRPEMASMRHTPAPVGRWGTAKVALQAAQALPARTAARSCPESAPRLKPTATLELEGPRKHLAAQV